MNSAGNQSVKVPENMKNRILIPHVNNNKRAEWKGIFPDQRNPFVTMPSQDKSL